MITYQVEVVVPDEHVEEWCSYMTLEHVNDVLRTGHFVSARLMRLLDPLSDGSVVFRVIYHAHSHEALDIYRKDCAPALQAHHSALFGDAIKATRSVSQDIWSSE